MEVINRVSFWIGSIGILVIMWGVILSVLYFLYYEYIDVLKVSGRSKTKEIKDKHTLRQELGSYILLGLEFMIAGDIIHTIIKPDKNALIVLGSIVAIRTVISFFLNKELKS